MYCEPLCPGSHYTYIVPLSFPSWQPHRAGHCSGVEAEHLRGAAICPTSHSL